MSQALTSLQYFPKNITSHILILYFCFKCFIIHADFESRKFVWHISYLRNIQFRIPEISIKIQAVPTKLHISVYYLCFFLSEEPVRIDFC